MTIAGLGIARAAASALAMMVACGISSAFSAETPATGAATATQAAAGAAPVPEAAAPEPLSADELEVLVARIALYPDELVAAISQASLYPLQIVQAARFLEKFEKDKTLKPREDWDGSVISLLNYPEVVRMMSEDLDWTQSLGDALTYQQKDVLIAIQQLRDEAVAKGIIKSDDKIQVVESGDNVIIQPTVAETIYVPQYEPQMLYAPNYPPAPMSYYPQPYPSYYYPTAGFFAGAVTGALWGAAMDWDDWDVWGGDWDGGNLDIDCNNCLNNIRGKVNLKDVDWKNVDRSKINFDRSQLANVDRTKIKDGIKANRGNSIRTKAADVRRDRPANRADRAANRDIRKSALGDQNRVSGGAIGAGANRPNAGVDRGNRNRPTGGVNRPSGKPKAGARVDRRPNKPSALGNVDRGKVSKVNSNRGRQSMGGGARGGGQRHVSRGGGQRSVARGGGGRGGAARGGGGRRGGGGGRGGGGRRR